MSIVWCASEILLACLVRLLGRAFTVDVSVVEGQALHTTGFHRRVRHPSYAFSLVPPFLAFRYRIKVEKALLLRHFGEAYADYMRRTKLLLPWLH